MEVTKDLWLIGVFSMVGMPHNVWVPFTQRRMGYWCWQGLGSTHKYLN
jgi:hypothetical protein